jgi:CBS domain-containing protein
MKVEQLMTRNVERCRADDRLNRAAQIMWEHDCGVVPVVAAGNGSGRVVGMLTDRDICMAAYTQGRTLADIPVASVMSDEVCSCRPSDAVAVALKVMQTKQIRRLPVVDQDDQLVGLLSIADIGREAAREHGTRVGDVTDANVGAVIEAVSAPRSSHALVAAP